MKTILITSFHPHISRNILSTEVLRLLKAQEDLRIVIVTADYKQKYFKENFADENVFIEGIKLYQFAKTKFGILFKKMELFLSDTDTARFIKRHDFYHNKKLLQFIFAMTMGFLAHLSIFRKIMRYLDLRLSPNGIFIHLIEKHKPDLVFSTDAQNGNDVLLMQDARRAGIPIVGMLRSWDNPTIRFLRFLPDKLFVGSNTLKEEVIKFYRYPNERIIVTGNPHYGRYLKGPTMTKEQFFSNFKLNPNRRLILYAPIGDMLIKHNDVDQYVMEMLGTVDAQVLVRFPPDEDVTLVNFSKPSNMVFDRPGVIFKEKEFGNREISAADDGRLIDSIYFSDLVITGPTSICLDATLLDKPVIAVNFYPSKRHLFENIRTYHYNHIKKLLLTGGVHYATSPEDFLKAINDYLRNPELDKEGRQRIRSLWFSHADGKASERLVKELLIALELRNNLQ